MFTCERNKDLNMHPTSYFYLLSISLGCRYEGDSVATKRLKVALSDAQLLHAQAVKTAKAATQAAAKAARKVRYRQAELVAATQKADAAAASGDKAAAAAARREAERLTLLAKMLAEEATKLAASASAATKAAAALMSHFT